MARVTKAVTASMMLEYIANNASNIVVARRLGAADLAMFSRAFQLMARPCYVISDTITRVVYPAMARDQEDYGRLRYLYLRSSVGIALIMLPFALVCWSIAPVLIHVLLGPKWIGAVPPFRVLAIAMVLKEFNAVNVSLLQAISFTEPLVRARIAYAAGMVVFAAIGSYWGLVGTAVGVFFANFVQLVYMGLPCIRKVAVSPLEFAAAMRGPLVVASGACAASWLTVTGLSEANINKFPQLSAGCSVGILVTLVLTFLLPAPIIGDVMASVRGSLLKMAMRKLRPRMV